jgi:hypothetical protein
MVLSPELFQCIPPSARAEFQQKRAALAKQKQGEMTQGQATDNKERDRRGSTPLPRQYEVQKKSANHAGQDSDDDNSSASSDSKEDDIQPPSLPAYNQTAMANIARALEDLALDDVEHQANLIVVDNDDSEDESLTTDDDKQSLSSASMNPSIANARVVNMATTVRTGTRDVHIEERLGMNMRALLTSMMPCTFYCISDLGADTTIFGDGWVVIGFSHRRANLIGFDRKVAKKKNLPICLAITIVKTPNGKVLLKAHEGVRNKGSPISLLSEYQTRDHGCVVDSVHRSHRKDWDGNYGTQSFRPTADIIIPLSLRKALMTFPIREPMPEELETLTPVEIMLPNVWVPAAHDDNLYDLIGTVEETVGISGPPFNVVTYPSEREESTAVGEGVSDAKLEMHTTSRCTQDGVDEPPPLGPLTRKNDEDDLTSMSCTTGATIGRPLDLGNPFSDEVTTQDLGEDVLESGMYANCGNLEDAKEPDIATSELVTDNAMESDELYYFDPDDLWQDEYAIGKEVNLTISGEEIMRDAQLQEFVSDLGYEELTGYNEDFDTFEYGIQVINGLWAINKFDDDDLKRLHLNLAWKPLEVICQTLKNTTQFARDVIRFPMHRHFALRWLWYGTK